MKYYKPIIQNGLTHRFHYIERLWIRLKEEKKLSLKIKPIETTFEMIYSTKNVQRFCFFELLLE